MSTSRSNSVLKYMQISPLEYTVDGRTFAGVLADGSGGIRAPGILVAHEGGGLTNHAIDRAKMLASIGYVALAMDIFGERPADLMAARRLVQQLTSDPMTLRRRAHAALEALAAWPHVDPRRLGAIGFCFGGTTVLELGRSGAALGCVVGFHSGLRTGSPEDARNIKGRILVCMGAADPIVDAAQREAFAAEMEAAKVDWRMELYGCVGHSFTTKDVDALGLPGFAYDEKADRQSWRSMRNLFGDVFGC